MTRSPESGNGNQRAIDLVEGWLDDDSGYDEENWPRVKARIEENRLSYRRRFAESGREDFSEEGE